MPSGLDMLTDRSDLYDTVIEDSDLSDRSEPGPGQALLRVDLFGFSANNITYATFGDAMGYWAFFPARDGYGRVPVWGFADVVASAVPGVEPGSRYFGYFPPSTHLMVTPGDVTDSGFVDASPHRSALPAVYNQYVDTANDPSYDPAHEAIAALLRPLFLTAFLLDDFLDDNDHFGSESVVVTSASSKTAFLFADLYAQRTDRPALIGLTSPSNVDFVERLGVYDRVLTYGEATSLPVAPTAIVDIAGDQTVIDDLHGRLGDSVTYSGIIGATHVDPSGDTDSGAALGDPRRTFFFAPEQMAKRNAAWGSGGVAARAAAVWSPLAARAMNHLNIVRGHGPESVRRVYEETIRGSSGPEVAHVLTMWGDD